MDDFGSRFGQEEDEDYDEEADPFDAIFDDEDIIERQEREEQTDNSKSKAHRGTFVGTPLYATPEMLNYSVSGPFTDLWALGVIVFQLITGEVPWKGNKDFIIFQQISDRKIQFPNDMNMDAVNLID